MKTTTRTFALAVSALALSTLAVAQKAPVSLNSVKTTQSAQNLKPLTLVLGTAELQQRVDVKKAKKGDVVTAKLTQSVKLTDTTTLARGTVLVGRVDAVQTAEGKGGAAVTLTFDKARVKGGQEIAVKTMLIGLASPSNSDQEQRFVLDLGNSSNVSLPQEVDQIPGDSSTVGLKSSAASETSGEFLSKGSNLRVLEGSRLQVGLAPAASTVASAK